MPAERAYQPYVPARRPGSKPTVAPKYRVLVHRRFANHWEELAERAGEQQAQELWDHLAQTPEEPPPTANTCFLRGKAGKPKGPGWSRTIHYEVTSKVRVDYQVNSNYVTAEGNDPHPVVAVLTLNFSSH